MYVTICVILNSKRTKEELKSSSSSQNEHQFIMQSCQTQHSQAQLEYCHYCKTIFMPRGQSHHPHTSALYQLLIYALNLLKHYHVYGPMSGSQPSDVFCLTTTESIVW